MTGVLHLFLQEAESLHGSSGHALALLLEVTLKGTFFISFALVLTLAMRRASAASRHLVWTLALSAVLALPVLSLAVPAWKVAVFSLPSPASATERRAASGDLPTGPLNAQLAAIPRDGQPAGPARSDWILFLWVSGVVLSASWMSAGEVRVRRLTRRSHLLGADPANTILEDLRRRLRISRSVELRTSAEIGIPFTRGVIRPAILLPQEALQWPEEQLEFVLAHELAHVCRHDCLVQVPAQIACGLFWFHPLVWLAWFQMRKERECACDDIVLSLGHQATDYAEFLLLMGRGLRSLRAAWSTRVAMAQPSQLEVRMKALLNSELNHRPLAASRVLFAAVIAIALLVPTAVVHATARNETADISGTVRSPGGALVAGANVTLINVKTLKRVTTSTGDDGSFEFRSLPAGRYKAEIDKPGLTPTNIREFELKPSRNVLVVAYIGHSSETEPRRLPHAQVPTPKRIRIGGEIEADKLIYHVSPEYPPLAKMAKIQGMVKLEAIIDEDGKVEDLKVLSGRPLLVKAALDAVRQWRYKPTYLKGVPAKVETTINVNFILAH